MAKSATGQDRLNQLFDADPRSDTDIGIILGVSKQTISAWRNGTRSPKKSMLFRIAEIYQVPAPWLLGWDVPTGVNPVFSDAERQLLEAWRAADDRARSDALNTLLSHPRG